MATDKSLNIRQIKAAEETAGGIEEIKVMLAGLSEQLKALAAKVDAIQSRPATKFEAASRSTAKK